MRSRRASAGVARLVGARLLVGNLEMIDCGRYSLRSASQGTIENEGNERAEKQSADKAVDREIAERGTKPDSRIDGIGRSQDERDEDPDERSQHHEHRELGRPADANATR